MAKGGEEGSTHEVDIKEKTRYLQYRMDTPAAWAADSANPEQIMTFREFLDPGGRWHP